MLDYLRRVSKRRSDSLRMVVINRIILRQKTAWLYKNTFATIIFI